MPDKFPPPPPNDSRFEELPDGRLKYCDVFIQLSNRNKQECLQCAQAAAVAECGWRDVVDNRYAEPIACEWRSIRLAAEAEAKVKETQNG